MGAIAIDFGTSNTVVTRWNVATQKPETLAIPELSWQIGQNPPLIPSLIYVQDAAQGKVLVGREVLDQGLDGPKDPRCFRNFKRGIGTSIQGFLPNLDGQAITFEQVGEWFLRRILTGIQGLSLPIDALVLTVPVDSFEPYRYWLGQVCQSLPVNQVRLLDEPTAAALGYGLGDQEILLVLDFGGGTLDLSLVQLEHPRQRSPQAGQKPLGFLLQWGQKSLAMDSGQQPRIARVLAKAGQSLGGADLDQWVADYFAQTQGLAVSPLTLRLAERLKIQLSLQSRATEVYFDDRSFESYDLTLERSQFEAILREHHFFASLDASLDQVLQQAKRQGLAVTDINAILAVGGTAQIPAVQQWLQQYFEPPRIRATQPFEAIAQGALQIVQDIELKDFLHHPYGLRYWDRRNNRHGWHPIIQAGQPYPMQQPVELVLGASVENQPSIEVILGELGTETGGPEIYFDGDRLVTRNLARAQPLVQPLNDRAGARTIAKLSPLGFPGSDRVKLLLRVDEQRFLRLTVEDLLTHETLLDNQPVVQLS